jgi:hypothetical protein
MVEDGRGDLDEQSWGKDQAKVQNDEKLDEEHEWMPEAREEWEEVCISIWINTSTWSMIHS